MLCDTACHTRFKNLAVYDVTRGVCLVWEMALRDIFYVVLPTSRASPSPAVIWTAKILMDPVLVSMTLIPLFSGLCHGERMGFGALCVYGICRELTGGKEWFAMGAAGSYSGLIASIVQKQRGMLAFRTIRYGKDFTSWFCFFE